MTTRSHANAKAEPIPAAAPLIAPMTGFGIFMICKSEGLYPLTRPS